MSEQTKRKALHNSSCFPHTTHITQLWKVCRKHEELFYMKATGIVRRIDDLGRIVIPKEIRRTLRIREADPLEIFTDREGEIILKKYSPIGEMTTFARQYAESLAQVSGHTVLIADRDQFIAAAGGCRNLIGKPLSREMAADRKPPDCTCDTWRSHICADRAGRRGGICLRSNQPD